MEKIIKWIKKNIGITIIFGLSFVLLIILAVIFVKLLTGGASDKYGNRTEGIEEVKISNEIYDGVKTELMDTGLVKEVNVRLQGKIIYTTIDLNSDVSLNKAKELANNTLDNYEAEMLGFYDFSYFLRWEGEESTTIVTGNKHHNLEVISWVRS